MNESTDMGPPNISRCVPPDRLPDTIHPAIDYVQAGIVLITMILAFAMNGFVVYLIARNKVLHKMAFFLALQLIVPNLIFSVTVLPFMFVTAILREWHFGQVMCQVLGSIHDMVITSRYLIIFVLTIDRVIAVFYPFFHLQYGGRISIFNSTVAWILTLTRSVTSLEGVLNCTKYLPVFKMCSGAPFCSKIYQIHTVTSALILIIFGVVIPFILYVILFSKAKIIRYRFLNSIRIQDVASPVSLPNVGSEDTLTTAANGINSTRLTDEHNHRATVTFILLTSVIIGCALPPYVLYTAQNIVGARPPPLLIILQIIVGRTFLYCLAVVDPIVFLRNCDIRELFQHRRAQAASSNHTGCCFSWARMLL